MPDLFLGKDRGYLQDRIDELLPCTLWKFVLDEQISDHEAMGWYRADMVSNDRVTSPHVSKEGSASYMMIEVTEPDQHIYPDCCGFFVDHI